MARKPIEITCRHYCWRGAAYRAHHFYMQLEREDNSIIESAKFNTFDEAKLWAIERFMKLFDMRTHTLNIVLIRALGNQREEFNWKKCDWFEYWWKKKVLRK